MQKLLNVGIASKRGIMTAHQETAYKNRNESLPISEDLRDNSIIIPLFNEIKENEIIFIIQTIYKLFNH